MKRFLLLFLTLALLVCLKAEEKEVATGECVCKEGEKNCPCLAQKAEDGSNKDKDKKKSNFEKKAIKKAKDLKARLDNAAKEAAKLKRLSKNASPALKKKIEEKKKEAMKVAKALKKQLKTLKEKVTEIKEEIKEAPEEKIPELKKEKKVIKSKCEVLANKIAEAEKEVKLMKKEHARTCIAVLLREARDAKEKAKTAKGRVIQLKIIVKELKAKLKKALPSQRPPVEKKLKEAIKELKKAIADLKAINKKADKLDKKASKYEIKKQRKLAVKMKKQLDVEKMNEAKIRGTIKGIIAKIDKTTKIIRQNPKSKKIPQYEADLKILKQNLEILQKKLAKIVKKNKMLFKATQQQIVRAANIKKDVQKAYNAKRCIILQKKLQKQISIATKLKTKFVTACEEVSEVKIARVEHKIQENRKKIAEVKIKLAAEKKKVIEVKKKIQLKCEQKLKKERAETKAYMSEINGKLKIIEDQAALYKKMLAEIKREAQLRAKAEKLNILLLEEKNEETRKEIEEKVKSILGKADEIKKQQVKAKLHAEAMQKELEKKAQELMEKQRQAALIKQTNLLASKKQLEDKMKAIKHAMEQAHDINIKKALENQRIEEEQKLIKFNNQIKLAKEKAKALQMDIELVKQAISQEAKEAAAKKLAMQKLQRDRMAKLRKTWKEDAKDDLESAVRKMKAFYAEKVARLQKELAQIVVEKDTFTAYSKRQYEKDEKEKLKALQIEYDAKIDKLNKALDKAKKDQTIWKLQADGAFAKEKEGVKAKAATKLSKKVQDLEKKLKKAVEDKDAAVKSFALNLKEKLAKDKANFKQQIMALKSEIASYKAEALNKEVKMRGDVAKMKAAAETLNVTLEGLIEEVNTENINFENLKNETTRRNKERLDAQVKDDKLLVAASKAKLAKIQKEYLDAKNELIKKINAANNEQKLLARELQAQQQKYKVLTAEFKALKETLSKRYKEEMSKEKEIYKELEEDYRARLKECEEEYKERMAEAKKIMEDITAKEKVIQGYKDLKEKRKKLGDTITIAEKEVAAHAKKVTDFEITRKSLCEMGTPGADTKVKCATLLADSGKLKLEDAALQKKVDDLRKQLDAL